MFKKILLAFGLAAGTLVVPGLAPTTSAAPTQISVWKASGLQQTSNSYWEPILNQPADYTRPTNYAEGRAFIKIDVTSKPSDLAVKPLVCFWTHVGTTKFKYETCARLGKFQFTDEGTYYLDLNAPTSWWKKNGVFDWSVPPSLGRIMIAKANVRPNQLLLGSRCGAACYKGDDLADHIPIKMSSELIFVAKGKTLNPPADWRADCPTDWSGACNGGDTPPPPPPPPPPTGDDTGTTVINITAGATTLEVAHRIPDANRYQIRYTKDGGGREWMPTTTAETQTISGLRSATEYEVGVRGLVSGVWQPWISSNATTTGSTGGGDTGGGDTGAAVSIAAGSTTAAISATPSTTSLSVSFDHPKALLYQLRYRPTGSKKWTWGQPTTKTSALLTPLDDGQYTVQVRILIGKTWQRWATLDVAVA